MPNPRKSRAELALTGTLQAHPKRYSVSLTQTPQLIVPIGRPPSHLKPAERAAWADIVKAAPPGLLTKGDRIAVEVAALLTVRLRTSTPKPSEFAVIMSVLGKLGLTPADRLKMNPEPAPQPFADATEAAKWAELDALD